VLQLHGDARPCGIRVSPVQVTTAQASGEPGHDERSHDRAMASDGNRQMRHIKADRLGSCGCVEVQWFTDDVAVELARGTSSAPRR